MGWLEVILPFRGVVTPDSYGTAPSTPGSLRTGGMQGSIRRNASVGIAMLRWGARDGSGSPPSTKVETGRVLVWLGYSTAEAHMSGAAAITTRS